jgi:hypothetical protein
LVVAKKNKTFFGFFLKQLFYSIYGKALCEILKQKTDAHIMCLSVD